MTPTADLMKLVEKWREEADEFERDGGYRNSIISETIETNAAELAAALTASCDARVGWEGVWFSVDVDALMEAATRATINCNFYAEIDGVAYSRLPTKDMAALSDVIMRAIGEKA